jgi:hypothetical protein
MNKTPLFTLTFAVAACFAPSSAANAQRSIGIHDGGWMIAGTASISRADDQTGVEMQPAGFVFVTPHLAIGGVLPFGYQPFAAGRSLQYGIGPTARYYFGAGSARLLPYIGASVMGEWQKINRSLTVGDATLDMDSRTRSAVADGSAGVVLRVAAHVGISGEAYVQRRRFETTSDGDEFRATATDQGVRLGVAVFLH